MASRIVGRLASRRFSGGGKVLSEEEKAAENVYIKKIEQEKLEKLARKGPKPEETVGAAAAESTPISTATSGGGTSSSEKVSTDKFRNYAVVAGVVTGFAALGWYLKGSEKKPEIQD